MPTENADILPATIGLDLGSAAQPWDGFFRNVQIDGILSGTAIPSGGGSGSGNATQLQGRNLTSAAPANTQVIAWNASLNQWEPQNQTGGGGGASLGFVTTPFSATPVFTPSPVGACTFKITLTANVTSSAITTAGVSAGALFTWMIEQDGVGNHTFVFPPICFGFIPFIGSSAGQTTIQTGVFDGSNIFSIAPGAIYP